MILRKAARFRPKNCKKRWLGGATYLHIRYQIYLCWGYSNQVLNSGQDAVKFIDQLIMSGIHINTVPVLFIRYESCSQRGISMSISSRYNVCLLTSIISINKHSYSFWFHTLFSSSKSTKPMLPKLKWPKCLQTLLFHIHAEMRTVFSKQEPCRHKVITNSPI